MQRIDSFFLFQTGHRLHKILEIRAKLWDADTGGVLKRFASSDLLSAENALADLLFASVFDLTISRQSGIYLLDQISKLRNECESCEDETTVLEYREISPVQQAYREFEAVLKAELGQTGVFLVADKNAMNTLTLIEEGERAFPPDLATKVPEAIPDVRDAMSCIALELPTAAAFHLHRANESVLKRYWRANTEEKIPAKSTMGHLVRKMEEKSIGKEEIRSSLKDIIRLHRNPTVHPEQRIEDVEEAINLYGAIRSVIGFMTKEIPEVPKQA